jgi:polysaccharide biosynthesis protein VpsQ
MHKLITATSICFFMFILWIIHLANMNDGGVVFDFVKSIPYGDKVAHTLLFGLLALMVTISLKFRTLGYGRVKIYYGALLVSLFVVAEEFSQIFIPARTFDLGDLAGDAIGILVAVVIAYFLNKNLTKNEKNN